jgi:hypothetical protein
MANQFSAAQGVMDRSTYTQLLNKAVDVMWLRKDRFAGNLGDFFVKMPQQSGMSVIVDSVSSVVGLPRQNEDTDPIPYAIPATGFPKTFDMAVYRLGIRATKTLMLAQRFDRVTQMAGGVIKSAMRKMEYLRAKVFNEAFATTTGADASYLCASSHLHENPEAGTWDNLGTTGVLSYTTLQELRLLADKMTNEGGYPDPVQLLKLLIPPDLRQSAMEYTRSKYVAGGSLNTETQLVGDMEIVVSPFLAGTDDFFGIGNLDGEEKGLMEITLEEPNMVTNSPANGDIILDRHVRFITKVGFTVSKNVYGNPGS